MLVEQFAGLIRSRAVPPLAWPAGSAQRQSNRQVGSAAEGEGGEIAHRPDGV
jgi:hypothetical protein